MKRWRRMEVARPPFSSAIWRGHLQRNFFGAIYVFRMDDAAHVVINALKLYPSSLKVKLDDRN